MADTQTADVSHFIRELDETDFYADDEAGTPDTSPAARFFASTRRWSSEAFSPPSDWIPCSSRIKKGAMWTPSLL